jgi:hypothetical protein
MAAQTRGIRNNNPCNIRRTVTAWRGLADEQTDKAFWQFKTPAYGYRAAFIILQNYHKLYGLTTIEKIISRWAPPTENDTQSYIQAVAQRMGVTPQHEINFADVEEMIELVAAISQHENGVTPNMQDIYDGWELI